MTIGDFTVASCNLLNLNLPGLRLYRDSDGWSAEEYERKVAWLAPRIAKLDCEIIGFQELWHSDALVALFERSGLVADYDLLVPPDANGKHIVCAAAVKKHLLEGEPEWIDVFPTAFRLTSEGDDPQTPEISVQLAGFHRPVLHFAAKLRHDKPAAHVYVCHLKSKAPTRVYYEDWYRADVDTYKPHAGALGAGLSTIRRTAEATALRWYLDERMKNTNDPVIVLGDLNDGQHSNTLNILTAQPRFLKPGGRTGGRDTALYSAQALQQLQSLNDVYYTHVYQDVRESLDHVLVSEEFYDFSSERIWGFHELTIENDHLNSDDHDANGSTDHGLVRVEFRYRPRN